MLSALSVDVEDGISIAMRDRFGRQIPQTGRVVKNTQKVLEMLEQSNSTATFFVLGQVADSFPCLVREIVDAGHEIGVHGYDHIVFGKLNPESAYIEVTRAKKLLEDISGNEVFGHRAPCFSIAPSTAWALDVLLDAGFKYDSSIMPGRGFGYGWPGQRTDIGPMKTPQGRQILEVPLTVVSLAGVQIPALGGSYFRLLPYVLSKVFLSRVTASRPAIVYLHPYELDPERYPDFYFEELRKSHWITQLRMRSFWLRRRSLAARYTRLLSEHTFVSIREILDLENRVELPVTNAECKPA